MTGRVGEGLHHQGRVNSLQHQATVSANPLAEDNGAPRATDDSCLGVAAILLCVEHATLPGGAPRILFELGEGIISEFHEAI